MAARCEMADPLDRALAAHLRTAFNLIAARLDDAHAHANRNNIPIAAIRLIDLHHALAGPHGHGLIGDARAAFYRDAHDDFDESIHDPDRRHPTPEGMTAARTAPIGGIDSHRQLGLHIDQARVGLVTAMAGRADPSIRQSLIDTWHSQTRDMLVGWARRTLSDSQVALNGAVSFLRLRQEFRDQSEEIGHS